MEFIIGAAALIVLIVLFILIGYVKAPPDTAYMISGFRKPHGIYTLFYIFVHGACIAHACQVSLYICQKYRHTAGAEGFRHDL